jgi:hypothetical protein
MALRPDGTVFFTGPGSGGSLSKGWIFNPATRTWTGSAPTTGDRTYGTAVILPLLPPSEGHELWWRQSRQKLYGDHRPLRRLSELDARTRYVDRIQMNAVILPNGTVLALDGSVNNEAPDSPGKAADLYDPVTNMFGSSSSPSRRPRRRTPGRRPVH